MLDEAAHLATAWLVLAAAGLRTRQPLVAWALLAVVTIDVDHVPLYLGVPLATMPGGRPVTHSLALAAVLVAAALLARRRRTALLGLSLGVLLHLARDLFSGWGAPLLWPLLPVNVRLPLAAHAVALALLTGVAVAVRTARPVSGAVADAP
ncbi:LexA-binding, inner membrane-associated putative hydrolase [Geodermatophilus normandii]|uniref:LexA-binding, inner membrane-associated putative hydrolase n=1 Tax=Geodermatophilus normandii TaxID=1137989 RepID=A0A317QFS4_9ACTN|nr:LexA-binding, inner membrane-associated putative hydrolase [Geodermatophilus normandii]